MRRNIAIGNEFFSSLIDGDFYYVDKTPWIKRLLNSGHEVQLITRPRRFGKTLFMNTIRSFLEPDFKNPGDTARQVQLFSGLKILEDKAFCERFMGKVPVMLISFGGIEGLTFKDAYQKMAYRLVKVAKDFSWLLVSPRLTKDEKKTLENYCSKPFMRDLENCVDVGDFIDDMVGFLAKHYNRRVVLLIDEYDVPLAKAVQYGYYKEMLLFVRQLLGPLKPGSGSRLGDKPALEKTILTGCLRVSKESIFTGLNNLDVNTVCSSDQVLSSVIGFTQQEVDQLLKYYGLEARRDDVKAWYDGYRFASSEVYCPWDVLNFCDKAIRSGVPLQYQPKDYWTGTSGNEEIGEFLGFLTDQEAEQMQTLVDGGEISFSLNEQVTYDELKRHRAEDFWTLLLFTGYLTLTGPVSEGVCRARIPNKEVRETFKKRIQSHFSSENTSFSLDGEKLVEAALACDAGKMRKILNAVMRTYISVRDTATRARAENYYHGFLLALLTSAEAKKRIYGLSSNHEAGDGYADIVFLSDDTETTTGVVIELKHCAPEERECAAKEALVQIREKRYVEVFKMFVCHRYVGVGIAFSGKTCAVEVAELAI